MGLPGTLQKIILNYLELFWILVNIYNLPRLKVVEFLPSNIFACVKTLKNSIAFIDQIWKNQFFKLISLYTVLSSSCLFTSLIQSSLHQTTTQEPLYACL